MAAHASAPRKSLLTQEKILPKGVGKEYPGRRATGREENPPESLSAQGVTPAVISATRPLYWSIRRELWENRSIYLAPLAVGGVFLLGFLISVAHLPAKLRGLSPLDPMKQFDEIAMPYYIAGGVMMLTTMPSRSECSDRGVRGTAHRDSRSCSHSNYSEDWKVW